jgi:hypothetical protein
MYPEYADVAGFWNRALERAAQNLTIEKLFTALGLDLHNLTWTAIGDRLVDVALANINVATMCAVAGAAFYAATLMMRTMVALRVFGLISFLFFAAYGLLADSLSTFFLYLFLLPINGVRLIQIVSLIKRARVAAQGDMSMEWLKPFMDTRHCRRGQVLFKKGDVADQMVLIVTGKFRVRELGIDLLPGQVVGELGFVTPDSRRTQTVECAEGGEVLTITYERLLEIYFQNPEFGYYFLRLASGRLVENNRRLEALVAKQPASVQPPPIAVTSVGDPSVAAP